MESNPYRAPLEDQLTVDSGNEEPQDYELASRWARLGGAVLDGLIMTVVTLPILGGVFWWAYQRNDTDMDRLVAEIDAHALMISIAGFFIGIAVYLLVNGVLIYRRQQTVGKLIVGTRIIHQDGSPATGNQIVWARFLPVHLITQLPLGNLFALINALMIFRESKQCIHDNIAKTIVIKAR